MITAKSNPKIALDDDPRTNPVGSTPNFLTLGEYLDIVRPLSSGIRLDFANVGGVFVPHFDARLYERKVAILNGTKPLSSQIMREIALVRERERERREGVSVNPSMREGICHGVTDGGKA